MESRAELRNEFKNWLLTHLPSINLNLTEEQYDEVVRANLNHVNAQDMNSFYKHCVKYMVFFYGRQFDVIDSVEFEMGLNKLGVTSKWSSRNNRVERTSTVDGNVLAIVVLGIAVCVCGVTFAYLKK
jgi:hypothetical protein